MRRDSSHPYSRDGRGGREGRDFGGGGGGYGPIRDG